MRTASTSGPERDSARRPRTRSRSSWLVCQAHSERRAAGQVADLLRELDLEAEDLGDGGRPAFGRGQVGASLCGAQERVDGEALIQPECGGLRRPARPAQMLIERGGGAAGEPRKPVAV